MPLIFFFVSPHRVYRIVSKALFFTDTIKGGEIGGKYFFLTSYFIVLMAFHLYYQQYSRHLFLAHKKALMKFRKRRDSNIRCNFAFMEIVQ